MASSSARMTTLESLVAWYVASTLWRKLEEVVRLGDKKRRGGMSRTLELETHAKVASHLEHVNDICPHQDILISIRVPNNVHPVLGA